jgi:dsDNA-specific endonuclease/ATPase MutS2
LLREGIEVRYLDWEQREQIGFSFIIESLEIMTSFGVEKKKAIVPFENKEALVNELDNVEKMWITLKSNKETVDEIEKVFCRVKDIRSTIKSCKSLITLDDVELYEVKYFSLLMEELIQAYYKLNLDIESIKFSRLNEVVEILDPEGRKIPTFYIYEAYSESLKEIRAEKRRLEALIFKEQRSETVSSLKEQRLEVVVLEEEEELKIRKTLTEKLGRHAKAIEKNINSLGELDLLIAKAKLALKYGGIKPHITDSKEVRLEKIINPQIKDILEIRDRIFTPVSVELKPGTTVITGANMGGKTVALKTIVLNLLLGQCGFFVFAGKAEMPFFHFIYFISDDMQSVVQGLSTFGAEIVKIKEVVEIAQSSFGLIALDEFARGTNPKEGYYLVKSLCKYLNILGSISLISTHYDGILEEGMEHYQIVGLKNLDFSIIHSLEHIQKYMDYRLEKVLKDSVVPKDALNIARVLGLQGEILDIAKEFYKDGEWEGNGE